MLIGCQRQQSILIIPPPVVITSPSSSSTRSRQTNGSATPQNPPDSGFSAPSSGRRPSSHGFPLLDLPSTTTPSRRPSHVSTASSTAGLPAAPPPSPAPGSAGSSGLKAAATLLFVVVTTVTLWTPFYAVCVYRSTSRTRRNAVDVISGLRGDDVVQVVVTWTAFATFLLNPVVYGWMNRLVTLRPK